MYIMWDSVAQRPAQVSLISPVYLTVSNRAGAFELLLSQLLTRQRFPRLIVCKLGQSYKKWIFIYLACDNLTYIT